MTSQGEPGVLAADPLVGGRDTIAWLVLGLVLVLGVPLYLCMPLWWDVLHYDVCARTVLHGGALYRDAFDNNLPGITWFQAGVRAVVGWRPEALRLADLAILGGAVLLLLRWLPGPDAGRARVWAAAALAAFYLSTPEICHCQRDGWLLLPAALALTLRDRLLRLRRQGQAVPWVLPVLEGACWGTAFWIKPFVALPALACGLASALGYRAAGAGLKTLLRDAVGVLAGGLLVGGLGLAMLAYSGAWTDFWDTIVVWDREYADYAAHRFKRLGCLEYQARHYFPWSLIHVPALVSALLVLARAARERDGHSTGTPSLLVLAAFYLGLLGASIFAQLPHDYVMITTVFPAVVLVAAEIQSGRHTLFGGPVAVAFVLLAALGTPILQPQRLALWGACVRERSTPALRERLALNGSQWGAGNWEDLARVADFLRGQGVQDGELACLMGTSHWLYLELGVQPSTRFDVVGVMAYFFPAHADQIREELNRSRCRLVVSDLLEPNLLPGGLHDAPGDALVLPPNFPRDRLQCYPWNQSLVFRSGRYVVHRVTGPTNEIWWPKSQRLEHD